MNRAAVTLSVLFIAACGDAPTEPLDSQPEPVTAFAEVGGSATWYFRGTVSSVYPEETTVEVGDYIEGSVTFTLGERYNENDCSAAYIASARWTYTHEGVVYTHSADDVPPGYTYHNNFHTVLSCDRPIVPYAKMLSWTRPSPDYFPIGMSYELSVPNPADGKEFPLVPPPESEWLPEWSGLFLPSYFVVAYDDRWVPNTWQFHKGFVVHPAEVYAGPQAKGDCMNGSWELFGFKNQGQCVRYYNTGGDSR